MGDWKRDVGTQSQDEARIVAFVKQKLYFSFYHLFILSCSLNKERKKKNVR